MKENIISQEYKIILCNKKNVRKHVDIHHGVCVLTFRFIQHMQTCKESIHVNKFKLNKFCLLHNSEYVLLLKDTDQRGLWIRYSCKLLLLKKNNMRSVSIFRRAATTTLDEISVWLCERAPPPCHSPAPLASS